MSRDIIRKLKKIWERLYDKDYREAYMEEVVFSDIAAQIFSIRERRGWTQAALAKKLGIGQSKISAIESRNHNASLKTLLRISNALDIALEVKFLSFGDFVHSTTLPRQEKAILSFDDDSLPQIDLEADNRFESETISYAATPTFLKLRNIVHHEMGETFSFSGGGCYQNSSEVKKLELNIEFSTSGPVEGESNYVH